MAYSIRHAALRATASVAIAFGSCASAADLALVLGNSEYREMPDVPRAEALRDIARDLARNGFDVVAAFDQRTSDIVEAAQEFSDRSANADRILIILSGHVATTNSDAWLLGTDAGRRPDLLSVSRAGVSLSSIARLAGRASGRAVILVGPTGRSEALGPGAGVGTRGMDVPQGVTLARGSARAVRDAIFDGLLVRGTSLDAALSDLSARGFLSNTVTYSMPLQDGEDESGRSARAQEDGFWEAARALDTERSFELYLSRYPDGRFVSDARARLAALVEDQEAEWVRAEESLQLSAEDRRRIQRHLTLLGYNTRGVDGIFGPGTRNAISAWQQANGFPDTGYLDRRQWTALTAQARDIEQQREEEAARQDDAYWEQTGARDTIEGLRAYLDRYPRGRRAQEARNRLAVLEREADEAAKTEVRSAWRRAQNEDTVDAYRDFIGRYPDSRFADAARARIRELQGNADEDSSDTEKLQVARAEEREILQNRIVRLLAEQRLVQLGYRPGVPDGEFTDRTRSAIAQFQRDRGIFDSGYVDRETAAFLLAGR